MQLSLLPVEGEKAADFLQGYLTCDCAQITPGLGLPWALCNLKGRVVANGWAVTLHRHADHSQVPEQDHQVIGLILESSMVDAVAAMLTPYARFHRCVLNNKNIQPVYPQTAGSGEWSTAFGQLGLQAPTDPVDVNSNQFMRQLIDARFPLISAPVAEKFLPQVLNLVDHGSVDFNKGCYLGQEIVARAQFRGAVKKTVKAFRWVEDLPSIGQAFATETASFECVLNIQSDQNETNTTNSGIALGITRAEETA